MKRKPYGILQSWPARQEPDLPFLEGNALHEVRSGRNLTESYGDRPHGKIHDNAYNKINRFRNVMFSCNFMFLCLVFLCKGYSKTPPVGPSGDVYI